MPNHTLNRLGGLAIAATLVLGAGGCTTFFAGSSVFGNNALQVASVPNIGTYTAAGARDAARNHFRNGDYGTSAAFYKRLVELAPNDPEGYVGLAASYDRLRRFDLSDRVYARLYALTGGTAQYFNNVGYSYMLRGNLTAALTSFRRAKAADPNNAVVANNIQMLESGVTPVQG